jgi:hypothetical protein
VNLAGAAKIGVVFMLLVVMAFAQQGLAQQRQKGKVYGGAAEFPGGAAVYGSSKRTCPGVVLMLVTGETASVGLFGCAPALFFMTAPADTVCH